MKQWIDGFNGLLLMVMFLITCWQILVRFLPGESTVWSEEVARFLFVWIVFLGAASLARDEQHLRIEVLVDRLGPGAQRLVRILSALLVIPFLVFMTWGAYLNMLKQWNTFAPTVEWMRLGYVYLALVLGGGAMLFYSLRSLGRDLFRAWTRPAR